VIPEIVDYEVRRELLRSRKLSSIAELDNLKADLVYLPINTVALLKAAERPGKYIGQAGPEQVGADLVMFYDAV